MADRTGIEWTDATWNPVTGCTEVSPGCDHCYARTFAERWRGTPGHHFERGFDVQLRPDKLSLPLRWRRPRRVFVNSMSDLFHRAVPEAYIARVFAVMAATPQHTYQVLTKRHDRMRALLSRSVRRPDGTVPFPDLVHDAMAEFTGAGLAEWPLPNVWLGVSVEDQKWADIRIPHLLDTPAAVWFLSCEPLLGPVDLSAWMGTERTCGGEAMPAGGVARAHTFDCCTPCPLDWVIVGGESGPGARPMHPDWARGLRDQCTAAGVPFFFKQWGEWAPTGRADTAADTGTRTRLVGEADTGGLREEIRRVGKHAAGRVLDGRTWDEFPHITTDRRQSV